MPETATNALATTDTRFNELIRGLNAGDERAAKELHEACRATPALWDRVGGLEESALITWTQLIVPGTSNRDVFTRDRIKSELKRMRKDLRQDDDSHLEKLLIGRILAAWLQAEHADLTYADILHRGGSFKEAEYHQKRAHRAQQQLLRAVQSLATVRRLLRSVQVNIGQNQINVAG